MSIRAWGIVCAGMIVLCCAAAQPDLDGSWVGVWQGELDGQPSVILTLAEDTGTLEGTLVLNGINRDGGPHIAFREAHVLLHPGANGMTLSFAVKHLRGSESTMDFIVEQSANSTAKIHCLNCGPDAPTVEITKLD